MSEFKIYTVVSEEAVKLSGGNRGKMGVQIGHAVEDVVEKAIEEFPDLWKEYKDTNYRAKACLVAPEVELHKLYRLYKDKWPTALITDAAKTVFPRPIITCLGIGPIPIDEREDILKNLKGWT